MKKKLNLFTIFAIVSAFFFASCSQIELNEKELQPGSVNITLGEKSIAKTISPVSGYDYKDVLTWTMTITDTESGTVFTPVDNSIDFNTSPTKTVKLPINATYLVELSGTLTIPQTDTSSISIPYYGSETFTLSTENPTADVNVIVGAKKTEAGGGSFDFSMVINPTDEELTGYFSKADASSFTVKLVPYNSSNSTATEIELTNKTYTAPATPETASLSFTSEASDDGTIAAVDVPSGFYKLEVIFNYNDVEAVKTVNIAKSCDNLVEIVDGIKTSGSANVYVTYDDYKIFYGTTADADTTYSGNFASKPKNVDKIIESDPTASTVQINMTDDTLPSIDLTKWNNTNYSICDSSANPQFYTQKNEAGTTLSSITVYGGPSIPLVISNSSVVSGKQDVVNLGTDSTTFTANSNLYLTVNNSICVNITNKDWVGGLYIENESYDETYSTNPIIKSPVSIKNSLTLSKALIGEDYMIVEEADSSSDYNYYIRLSTDQDVNVSGIPSFKLAVKKADGSSVTENTFVSVDDVLTFSLTEDVAIFPTGTTFTWTINGNAVTSDTVGATITTETPTLTLTIGECEYCIGNTTVLCYVTGTESASASFSFTPSEEVVVAYDISSSASTETIGFYKYNAGQTDFTENVLSDITTIYTDAELNDFTIDSSNNVYSLLTLETDSSYNVSKYLIRKSSYDKTGSITNTDYTITSTDISSLQYIKISTAENVYMVARDISGNLVFKKIVFSSDGSAVVTDIDITSLTDISSIETFFVDDIDEASINYYLVTSGTNSGNKILYKSTNTIDSSTSLILHDFNETTTTDVFNNMNKYDYGFEFGDMTVIDSTIYITAYTVQASSTIVSYGALAVITQDGTNFTPTIVGLDTGDYTHTGSGTETDPYIINYQHDESFYGAQKIVAIKPDELIIADDGFACIDTQFGSGSGTSKNRFATYDLNSQSLTFKDASCEFKNTVPTISITITQ